MNEFDGSIHTPDVAEPIIGYRVWIWDTYLSPRGNVHGRISSVTNRRQEVWDGGYCNALCLPGPDSDDPYHWCPQVEVPVADCTCGIYAFSEPFYDAGYSLIPWAEWLVECGHSAAVGIVELWGKVLEGERGYRAQRARAVDFFVLSAIKAAPHKARWYKQEIDVLNANNRNILDADNIDVVYRIHQLREKHGYR